MLNIDYIVKLIDLKKMAMVASFADEHCGLLVDHVLGAVFQLKGKLCNKFVVEMHILVVQKKPEGVLVGFIPKDAAWRALELYLLFKSEVLGIDFPEDSILKNPEVSGACNAGGDRHRDLEQVPDARYDKATALFR